MQQPSHEPVRGPLGGLIQSVVVQQPAPIPAFAQRGKGQPPNANAIRPVVGFAPSPAGGGQGWGLLFKHSVCISMGKLRAPCGAEFHSHPPVGAAARSVIVQ